MNDNGSNKHSRWISIWRQAVSFIIGVIVAAFAVGSARQKVNDVLAWKAETAPRIERMDRQGTTSFDLFHKEYERTQQRQEETLKELDKRVRELEKDGKQ